MCAKVYFKQSTYSAHHAICYANARGFNSIIYQRMKKRWVALLPTSFSLVEMTGVEPVSKNPLIQLSPGAECLLSFSHQAPTVRLLTRATVLCMTSSTVNHPCMFTTHITLSPSSWSYSEERAVRRPRHCQLLSPEGSIIRQP